jgi:hypothetical protein
MAALEQFNITTTNNNNNTTTIITTITTSSNNNNVCQLTCACPFLCSCTSGSRTSRSMPISLKNFSRLAPALAREARDARLASDDTSDPAREWWHAMSE